MDGLVELGYGFVDERLFGVRGRSLRDGRQDVQDCGVAEVGAEEMRDELDVEAFSDADTADAVDIEG